MRSAAVRACKEDTSRNAEDTTAGEGHGTEWPWGSSTAHQPPLEVKVSANAAVPASRTVFRLSLCSEDTCSKLNRPQPDRGEQVTGGSMEQGCVCIPCQPTGTALLLFPEEFVCSSSNGSAYVFKDKGMVRPQLVDLPGEAYGAVAL